MQDKGQQVEKKETKKPSQGKHKGQGNYHHKEEIPDWFSDDDDGDFNFGATIQKTQTFQIGIQKELEIFFEDEKK